MDTGEGRFSRYDSQEAAEKAKVAADALTSKIAHNIFNVGQELDIQGSKFRITSIGSKFMTLKLLPQIAAEERAKSAELRFTKQTFEDRVITNFKEEIAAAEKPPNV